MIKIQPSVEFIEGLPDTDYVTDFDMSVFNSSAYRGFQNEKSWSQFHVIRKDKKRVLASIFFFIEGEHALSPYKAPFGAFEMSEYVNAELLYNFVSYYEQRLVQKGVKRIIIKNYPEQYHLAYHNITSVMLFNQGYKVSNAEMGACLVLDRKTISDRLDRWELRKLTQAKKAKLVFRSVNMRSIEKIYSFIYKCRVEKGYPLSMSLEELLATSKVLKGRFHLFGVFLREELVAASIAIEVNKRTLYNFYSAHASHLDHLSPVVLLIQGMYGWCYKRKMRILDLGTSAVAGRPNFSLIDFKLRLGAIPAMKLTFEKSIGK